MVCMIGFTFRRLCSRENARSTHWIGGWVGPRAGLYVMKKCPARSQLIYRLRYGGSSILCIKKKLHGLSPRAKYIDRATAACRRSDCQLFADRGCHVVSVSDHFGRISRFSRQEPLLFYQVASQLYSRGCVDPVPDPLLFFAGSAWN
jgi:hypothetical protein